MHDTAAGPGQACQKCVDWRILLLVTLLAAAARVGWVLVRYVTSGQYGTLEYPDEDEYLHVARTLAAGTGMMDTLGFRATYMPGYPAFLAVFVGLARPLLWARLVQALLGSLVAPLAAVLASTFIDLTAQKEHGPTSRTLVVLLAGLAAAIDPFQVFFSGLLLTETFATVALVATWVVVLRLCALDRERGKDALAAGILLLLSVLLRPSAAVLVLLAPLTVLFCGRGKPTVRLRAGVVMVLVVVAGLTPWAGRNNAVIGEWRWLTTRGGITLYDGVRPGAEGGSDLAHTKGTPELQRLSEVEWDAWFRRRAGELIREDPVRILRLGAAKFLRTWSLTPNVAEYRRGAAAMASAGWMVVLLVLAVIGLWTTRRSVRAWAALLSPVLAYTLLHTIYVGSVRYRLPIMPLVMVLSAVGLAHLAGGRSRRSPDRTGSPAGASI